MMSSTTIEQNGFKKFVLSSAVNVLDSKKKKVDFSYEIIRFFFNCGYRAEFACVSSDVVCSLHQCRHNIAKVAIYQMVVRSALTCHQVRAESKRSSS